MGVGPGRWGLPSWQEEAQRLCLSPLTECPCGPLEVRRFNSGASERLSLATMGSRLVAGACFCKGL